MHLHKHILVLDRPGGSLLTNALWLVKRGWQVDLAETVSDAIDMVLTTPLVSLILINGEDQAERRVVGLREEQPASATRGLGVRCLGPRIRPV